MSKYTDFGEFLQEVVNAAGRKKPLRQTEKTSDLLKGGWASFLSVTSVFGLIFGVNNALPEVDGLSLAAKQIGIKYKEKFDAHKGEQRYIDALIEEASDELINRK